MEMMYYMETSVEGSKRNFFDNTGFLIRHFMLLQMLKSQLLKYTAFVLFNLEKVEKSVLIKVSKENSFLCN